ncbi:hypothetical protein Bbelb_009360 [Branchiostoma belcheri]|nr:hypothetical protein Bbelb_009360 [Branchiostoma belcheri]
MNHRNVTVRIARALKDVSEVVGVCEVVGNAATGNNNNNATLASVVFEPAFCGLYGAAPSIAPVLILVLVCFLLLTVFGNGCLVGVILTTSHMKEPGNYYLVAMALTDTALALAYNPLAMYSLAHGSYPAGPWYPLSYKKVLTRRRMVYAMCFCVVIAAAPAALGVSPVHVITAGASEEVLRRFEQPQTLITPCLAGPEGTILSVSVNLVAMVAIVCLVALICCETQRSQRKHDQKLAWSAQAEGRDTKMQAVYTLLIVVLVNWITWLPAFVVTILLKFGAVSLAAASPWIDVATIVLQSATFSDSLVYAFRYHIYRRALKKMYRKIHNIFTQAQA